MIEIAFLLLIMIHVLIHSIGFLKAYHLTRFSQLTQTIRKPDGIFWLGSAILLLASAFGFFLRKDWWWVPSLIGISISQLMIFKYWKDAKFGTIVNVIILFGTITGFVSWNYMNKYKQEVRSYLNHINNSDSTILTEVDIQHLPDPVKKYLYFTGAMRSSKIKNFRVSINGQIRGSEKSEWMQFHSEQYNFTDSPARLFFMRALMKGLPVAGFHAYKNGTAFMDIRLVSLFKVEHQSGEKMDIAETVTYFNDLCVMAPAALIDKRIKWESVDSNKVKAQFTNHGITISAYLYFNNAGELINFISDDRYYTAEDHTMKKMRWSTPLKEYKEVNGHKMPTYAELIWSFPDGDFCYGKFNLTGIEYNCKKIKENNFDEMTTEPDNNNFIK